MLNCNCNINYDSCCKFSFKKYRSILKREIKEFLKKYLNLKIEKYYKEKDYSYKRYYFIKNYGITQIIDIGAYNGEYALNLFKLGFKGKIYSFEPLPEMYHILKKKENNNWQIYNFAVGDSNKKIKFYEYQNKVSSSILLNSKIDYAEEVNTTVIAVYDIEMITIDSFFKNGFLSNDKTYLKIDAQGYEWQVLIGGKTVIDNFVKIIEIELSFVQLYDNQKLYIDIINYLNDEGWRLICINEECVSPTTLQTLQADFIFVKEPHIING